MTQLDIQKQACQYISTLLTDGSIFNIGDYMAEYNAFISGCNYILNNTIENGGDLIVNTIAPPKIRYEDILDTKSNNKVSLKDFLSKQNIYTTNSKGEFVKNEKKSNNI
jgi:hypothetical protein